MAQLSWGWGGTTGRGLALNWYAAAETDPNTVTAFAAAASEALALVKEALSD